LRNFFYRSAAIWKTLFSTNFAEISRSVEKKIERLADEDHDLHILWQKLFMQRFVAGKLVRREVERMSKKFFHRQDLSNEDMEHFVDLVPLFDGSDNFDEMEDEQKLKVLTATIVYILKSPNVIYDNVCYKLVYVMINLAKKVPAISEPHKSLLG
jgi:hypothetical protein